jgi:hypothetical protein
MPRRALFMLVALAGAAVSLHVAGTLAGGLAESVDVSQADARLTNADQLPGVEHIPGHIPGSEFHLERPRALAPAAVRESRPLPPGLAQQRDLRRRVAEAAGLRNRADAGDASAQAELVQRQTSESDPRVRQALDSGRIPDLGTTRHAPPALPEPAARADAGTVRAWWLTPQSHDGTYESSITVDAAGRATVETVFEQDDGQRWQVRYGAWAYRDAQGRLIVDARGQQVEYVVRPPNGWWSPDSMVIGTDGLIDMIDDKHDPGSGTRGAQGSG